MKIEISRPGALLIGTLIFLAAVLPAVAAVKLPAIFGEHMVLQQEMPAPVWGTADPGEKITVAFAGHSVATVADGQGRWSVRLKPLTAGQAGELVITGSDTITIKDVLVGEVWLASGQSNMAWPISGADNAQREIQAAAFPSIRLFTVARTAEDKPAENVEGAWVLCSPETVKGFSAVAYFFGREIHRTRQVPVGLISSAVGATPAQAWTSREALAADPEFARFLAAKKLPPSKQAPTKQTPLDAFLAAIAPYVRPTVLFNGMIAPLIPFALRGVIWYQGESNALSPGAAIQYRRLFPAMINDWRQRWGQGDLPFLFVQLANFITMEEVPSWAFLRESQWLTLSLPKTGMASAIDIGLPRDIHPTNKQEVGRRLALAARAIAYREKIVYSGPSYKSMQVEGGRVRLAFDHIGGGLVTPGGQLEAFLVAGAGNTFVPAEAALDGDNVVVWSAAVPQPTAVRYAWANNPTTTLFNQAGLPASPFRTDALPPAVKPPAPVTSPVNQVFQFMQSGTCTAWSDGSQNTATAYLWIPENCQKLRGLLIMCNNVPEHMLVGHPAIRQVCAAHDLGIVWSTPSFMNRAKAQPGQKNSFGLSAEYPTTMAFLRQLLDGLAQTSGYDEVATVPWLPMGESGHMLMVDTLMESEPDRCIAGIYIKNSHLPPHNRQVPTLVVFGTAQEWGQEKTDIRAKWKDIGRIYDGILRERKQNPHWALSYVIDGHSGHFDCSERLTQYFARYIDLAAKARLSDDGSAALKTVTLETGYFADLPVPGHENQPIIPATTNLPLPWYFDRATAEEAQAYAAINWQAESQFPAYLDQQGNRLPHDFNGITRLKTLPLEEDGLSFTVRHALLDKIPAGFLAAGEPLAKTSGTPVVEWLCGPLEPRGGDRFRIALDRVWLAGGPAYLGVRHSGTTNVRGIIQPVGVDLRGMRNTTGQPQKITFAPLADVPAGTVAVPLVATADSGLPVSFFVVAGPAVVRAGVLVFTPIPPRSKMPVEVTVAAWQWGRSTEPAVKLADIVQQTLRLQPAN